MDQLVLADLKKIVKGEVDASPETLTKFSHDASIFEVIPEVIVSPVDTTDVENLVRFVTKNKSANPKLSLTARCAGTDMSGGSLTDSIMLAFTPHFNKISEIKDNFITAETGVMYRDFEKKTLAAGLLFPAYPVSKDICGVGGIINNNSGGEKSLQYGKTERYVKSAHVVLADGNTYELRPLNEVELKEKLAQDNYEGEIYTKTYKLITNNYEEIMQAKPSVSKNSSGYSLWNVYSRDKGVFDLTQLFVGAQGTLGIMLDAKIELVPRKLHAEMLVIYMSEVDIPKLGEIINTVLPFKPESFETYDSNTLKLAVKYFSEFGPKLDSKNIFSTAIKFLPEIAMYLTGTLPKLVLQAEFTGDDKIELQKKAAELKSSLSRFGLKMKVAGDEIQSRKYWLIRRDSFKLLKNKIKHMYASPFIDDFCVDPKYLSEFLPKFNSLMDEYPSFISTVAGHIGDGNFHIIPLVDIKDPKQVELINGLSKKVFDLVFEYHGSTSGEHNDGLIRTAYLKDMFGESIYSLFLEVKNIFDPQNIFNPGKKTTLNADYLKNHIRTSW